MSLANKSIMGIVPLIIISILSTTTFGGHSAIAVTVSGGENHTLVLTESKAVHSCGPNGDPIHHSYFGVLGTGSNDPCLTEWTLIRVHDGDMGTPSGYLEDINDIDAGWTHSLSLDINGFVWAWGRNAEGQLGDNSTTDRTTPVKVRGGEMGTTYLQYIKSISAGRSGLHSLACDANGFAYAWGYNEYGQCGNGQSGSGERELTPVKVKGVNGLGELQNIIAVSAGSGHSMALQIDDPCDPNLNGWVYTWGSNHWPEDPDGNYPAGTGKLGNGSTEPNIPTPVRVLSGEQDPNDPNSFLQHIVAISAGWDHCMALEKDDPNDPNLNGRVYTWGNNGPGWGNNQNPHSEGGRLGDGTTTNRSTPVLVLDGEMNTTSGYLENIKAISAGEGHSMALDANGYVYCWGDNYFGQLGNGTNDPCTTPVKVVGPDVNDNGIHDPQEGYLENIVAISAGFWHCLAIDSNGTVWTWGKGAQGRLGIGTIYDVNIPQRVPIVQNITQETSYFRIQAAIDDSNNADVIEASLGTFSEYIDFNGLSITVRSTKPWLWDIVEKTRIDANNYPGVNVVTFDSSEGQNSVLKGFTITEGARGIYCNGTSPIISNCLITKNETNNFGAGMQCNNASPMVTHCIFSDNTAVDTAGGGMYNYSSSPTVVNCIFSKNIDTYGYYGGGGICNFGSSPTVRNCTFSGNSTQGHGGGMYNDPYSYPNITNCIFWGDVPDEIYDGTPTVTYSDVEGGYTGEGNIDSDPCFADEEFYHLDANSPCIDAGAPGNYFGETDIDEQARVMGPRVDMGADEALGVCHTCKGDLDRNNYVMMSDYFAMVALLGKAGPPYIIAEGDPLWNPCADMDGNGFIMMSDLFALIKKLNDAGPPYIIPCEPDGGQGEGQGFGLEEGVGLSAAEQAIMWLDEIWANDPKLRESMTEAVWQSFIEKVLEIMLY